MYVLKARIHILNFIINKMKNKLWALLLWWHINICSGYSQTITHVTLTCYHPVKEQCGEYPLITSDGSKIDLTLLKEGKIKWCAVSRDLLWLFPKNKPKRVWIEGYGVYQVKGVIHKRHKHRIDILLHPKDNKLIYKKHIKIKILK